jgi:hypothetical protein
MTKDEVTKALRQAYNLGQIYWQQADSEYVSQHRKADLTEAKFKELVEATMAALEANDEPVAIQRWPSAAIGKETLQDAFERENNIPLQRTWVDLTDDEMLMIYGQQHEGRKYSLGRMVQGKLKEKNGC